MRTFLISTLLLAALLPAITHSLAFANAQSAITIVGEYRWSLVRIHGRGPDARAGTGFVAVGDGRRVLAVTTLSAVGRDQNVNLFDTLGRSHTGTVIYRDKASGIAIVSVTKWFGPRQLKLAGRALNADEPLVVLGFDVSRGVASYVSTRARTSRQLSKSVPAGFEGGLVVAVSDGQVVGAVGASRKEIILTASIRSAIEKGRKRPEEALPAPPPASRPEAAPVPPPSVLPPVAEPQPAPRLTISAFPAGATVSIDGRALGRTSLNVPLESVGQHRFSARAPGRLTITRLIGSSPKLSVINIVLPKDLEVGAFAPALRAPLDQVKKALSTGEGAEAVRVLQGINVQNTSLRIYLAAAYWVQGDGDRALSTLRDYVGLLGETVSSLDSYVLMGAIFEEQGDYRAALTRYKLAVKVQPLYAVEFRNPERVTDSLIRELGRQMNQGGSDPKQRIRLGLAYEAKGRFQEGVAQFKSVLFTVPTAPAGQTVMTSVSSDPALIIQTFPGRAFAFVNSRSIGQTPISIPPSSSEVALRIVLPGYVDINRKIRPGQRQELFFVLLPDPREAGRTPFAREKVQQGLQALALGDAQSASRSFREALDSDYTLFFLNVYVGAALFVQGRPAESLDHLRKYLNLKDDGVLAITAYALMGVILEEQSNFQGALTSYKLALRRHSSLREVVTLPAAASDAEISKLQERVRMTPRDPAIRYQLAIAYEAKGRFQLGSAALRHALSLLGPS